MFQSANICWYVQRCSCPSVTLCSRCQATSHSGREHPVFSACRVRGLLSGSVRTISVNEMTWSCKGWHNCGIFARAGSRDSVSLKVCVFVCQLSSLYFSFPFSPQTLLESNSVKWVSKLKNLKKNHPCCYVDFLERGQRDPECYAFDGRGSAWLGIFLGGYFWLVDIGARLLKKHWVPMRLSRNISNFCLTEPTSQETHPTWVSRPGFRRDNMGWQWNESWSSICNTADRQYDIGTKEFSFDAILCKVGRSSTWTFVNKWRARNEADRQTFGDLVFRCIDIWEFVTIEELSPSRQCRGHGEYLHPLRCDPNTKYTKWLT